MAAHEAKNRLKKGVSIVPLSKLVEEIEKSYTRWNYIKENGAQDPFWEDGCNMNLVRNHIFYYRNQIKEICDKEGLELPDIYYKEVPEEVDDKYMANVEKIIEGAKKSLEIYENDKYFRELESAYTSIKNADKKQIARNILGYKRGLKRYIESNDIVAMRRHLNYKTYIESAEKFMQSLTEEDYAGQVSIFDLARFSL